MSNFISLVTICSSVRQKYVYYLMYITYSNTFTEDIDHDLQHIDII